MTDNGARDGTLFHLARKFRRAVFLDEPGYYDMFENKAEAFFGRLYLHEISRIMESVGAAGPLHILDAGCQSGRLSIPLAKAGHRVTGVDTSAVGLTRARRHAKAEKIPLTLIRADLGRWLPNQRSGLFDIVVCTEVLYLRPNHPTLLEELLRVLKPGGLCFISHRPTAYYLAEALQRKDWEAIRIVMTQSEGPLFGCSYYNWQDREALEPMYARLDVEPLAVTPIGYSSWLKVDPANLNPAEQDTLFQAETDPQHRSKNGGRYFLFSGRKRTG